MDNKFTAMETGIEGLVLLAPTVYGDERGFFLESYSKKMLEAHGIKADFVQDNHSMSNKGVLRGLHFQHQYPQGKLVRVVTGSVFDVAVDLRKDSKTYGKSFGVELSGKNKRIFYIPPGFAHGFLCLEDRTNFLYKTTDYYHPEDEGGIRYDDPDLAIGWPIVEGGYIVSEKDQNLKSFKINSQ